MKVMVELEMAPGYMAPTIITNPAVPLVESLRGTYPFSSVITSAETNGLKVIRATISD